MKSKSLTAALVLAYILISGSAFAASIKAILVSTSSLVYPDISKGAEASVGYMDELLSFISKNANIPYTKTYIQRDKYTLQNIKQSIAGLNVDRDDVVIFFYNGHGFRSTTQMSDNDKFPAMVLGEESNYVGVKSSDIHKALVKKGARLTIAVFDSCNVPIDSIPVEQIFRLSPNQESSHYIPMIPESIPAIKKLFLDSSGSIIFAGAKPGQSGLVHSVNGGLFTNQLLNSIFSEVLYGTDATWASVGASASRHIIGGPLQDRSMNRQDPVMEIRLNSGS